MNEKRPIYVLDTNILVDYVDVIPPPEGQKIKLREPTIDLRGAHLVIPSAVVRELSNFKREKSDRGKAARVVLKRLRAWTKTEESGTWWDSYNMASPIKLDESGLTMSVFPVHKDFKSSLPFCPSDDDMDGQIILAAISVSYLTNGRSNDGQCRLLNSDDEAAVSEAYEGRDVVILTNDNGLAIRAHERGITTERFKYSSPAPYTGRRDLEVPKELFDKMYFEGKVLREDFERLMANEPRLVANEFVIMTPERPEKCAYFKPEHNPLFANVGRYDYDEDALVSLKYASSFPVKPLTIGQAIYAEALANPNILTTICTGPAGSGKTYMVTIYAYLSVLAGKYMGASVVPCENTSKLGALPGGLNSKMDPQVQPFKNALRNYLYKSGFAQQKNQSKRSIPEPDDNSDDDDTTNINRGDAEDKEEPTDSREQTTAKPKRKRHRNKASYNRRRKSLKIILDEKVEDIWRDIFSNIPIEVARGQDFCDQIAIYDEFQDQNASQADTLIKRIGGDHGEIVITGDIDQIHSPYLDENNNGIVYASELLYDSPMVARVSFTEGDVVRHRLVKMVAERQKKAKSQKDYG